MDWWNNEEKKNNLEEWKKYLIQSKDLKSSDHVIEAAKVPSLNSGNINVKTEAEESIFFSEDFKRIYNMFDEKELMIAKYKSEGRSDVEITHKLGITLESVINKINIMTNLYRRLYVNKIPQSTHRTFKSKK